MESMILVLVILMVVAFTPFLILDYFFNRKSKSNKITPTSQHNNLDYNKILSKINNEKRIDLSDGEFKSKIELQLITKSLKTTPIFWVGDKHRTHPWSQRPGGCTVVVIFDDNKCFGYDKVKRPHRYIQKISHEYLINYHSNVRIETLEEYIDCIYAVKENEVSLNLVWNKNMYNSPWEELEEYATM